MENITFDHRVYNEVMYIIMDEEDSLDYVKTCVEDDISKAVWKTHGKSTTDWAKYAHAHNLWYTTTVYDDGVPYCYIVNNEEMIEVYFLDERLFEFVFMAYRKMDNGKMFLSKVYVRAYMYKEKKALHDLKKDINMVFTPKGNLTVTTRRFTRDGSVKVETDVEEAAHPVNVSQNWKNIPEYGKYDELLNYEEIIKPGDLLNGIDPTAPAPVEDPEDTDPKGDGTPTNKWLPPDWNKN